MTLNNIHLSSPILDIAGPHNKGLSLPLVPCRDSGVATRDQLADEPRCLSTVSPSEDPLSTLGPRRRWLAQVHETAARWLADHYTRVFQDHEPQGTIPLCEACRKGIGPRQS